MSYAYRRRKKTLRRLKMFKKSHVTSRGGNTGMFNYDFFKGETMKHNLNKLKEAPAIVWWTLAIILAGILTVWFLVGAIQLWLWCVHEDMYSLPTNVTWKRVQQA